MEEEEGRGGEWNVAAQALSGGVKFLRANLGKRCLLSPNSDTLTLNGQRELAFVKAFTPTTMVYQNSLSNRPSSAYPLPAPHRRKKRATESLSCVREPEINMKYFSFPPRSLSGGAALI